MALYHMEFLPLRNLKPRMLVLPALPGSCWVIHCEGLEQSQESQQSGTEGTSSLSLQGPGLTNSLWILPEMICRFLSPAGKWRFGSELCHCFWKLFSIKTRGIVKSEVIQTQGPGDRTYCTCCSHRKTMDNTPNWAGIDHIRRIFKKHPTSPRNTPPHLASCAGQPAVEPPSSCFIPVTWRTLGDCEWQQP